MTGPKQLKTRSDVMIARGTCHVILVVVRSSFACTAEEEVDKMVSRENSLPKARPRGCLTYPDVRGTCHAMLAVVRSGSEVSSFSLVTQAVKASGRNRKATWQSKFDGINLEDSTKQQV